MLLALAMLMPICRADDAADAKAVLEEQAKAWNRGDLKAFLAAYENSRSITFTGKAVTRGFAAVQQRYEKNYGTPEKMGTLVFDEIEVRMLGKNHALILGRFALTRTAAGGGDASGRFTLVAVRTKGGWKFIHDHTS
jgi:uncharacterized protein (TIGR02246 family)